VLGGAIEGLERGGQEAGYGPDRDEAAGLSRAHRRQNRVDQPVDAEEVGLKQIKRFLRGRLLDGAQHVRACVVHHRVDPACEGQHLRHRRLDALIAGHVQLQRVRPIPVGVGPAHGPKHAPARAVKMRGDRLADTAGRAGHDDRLLV